MKRETSRYSITFPSSTESICTLSALILSESLKVLVLALDALHEEVKSLGLKDFFAKTKVIGDWRLAG